MPRRNRPHHMVTSVTEQQAREWHDAAERSGLSWQEFSYKKLQAAVRRVRKTLDTDGQGV